MKVVFVTSLKRGGPIEHTLSLAGAMVEASTDVEVICATADLAERFRAVGAKAAEIPLRRRTDLRQARAVWDHIGRAGADVVHAQDRRSGLWVRLGPRPRRGGLRILTVHGLPDEYLPPPVGPRRPGLRATLAYRGLDVALCRRADAVVAPSHAMARILVERLGYPRSRMVVIPAGVEVPAVGQGRLIGTVGALEPVKGLDVFLLAARRVLDRRPEARFAIFGSGPEEKRLDLLSERLGLGGRLERPGHVPRNQAFDRLGVFVLSSYMESCSLALLEAMAAGVPAIATRVGAVPEIAPEGTVELVEPGDEVALAEGICALLDDPDRRSRQAESARRRILDHYTPTRFARATVALYERLLGDR